MQYFAFFPQSASQGVEIASLEGELLSTVGPGAADRPSLCSCCLKDCIVEAKQGTRSILFMPLWRLEDSFQCSRAHTTLNQSCSSLLTISGVTIQWLSTVHFFGDNYVASVNQEERIRILDRFYQNVVSGGAGNTGQSNRDWVHIVVVLQLKKGVRLTWVTEHARTSQSPLTSVPL